MAKQIPTEGNERQRWQLAPDDICSLIGTVLAVQGADGKWFVKIPLIGEIQIDAERSLAVDRELSINVKQKGRKKREVKAEKGKKGFGE